MSATVLTIVGMVLGVLVAFTGIWAWYVRSWRAQFGGTRRDAMRAMNPFRP